MTEQNRTNAGGPAAGDIRASAPGFRNSVPGLRLPPSAERASRLKAGYRLYLLALLASAIPLAVFLLVFSVFGLGTAVSASAALAAAAAAAFALSRLAVRGLVRPSLAAVSGVSDFFAAGYRLNTVLSKEGWPEARAITAAMNRLMLELGAFHGFRLDQVVQERAKAEAMMETIADGVMLLDDAGKIICANRRALLLLGLEKDSPGSLPGAETNTAFSKVLAEILTPGSGHRRAEAESPVPGGPVNVLNCFQLVSAEFNLAGMKRSGHVLVLRDVTAEKEIEKTKETFFHMVTHDMRAPLTSVQGFAQLLLKTLPLSPATETYLNIIIRSAKRMAGMVEDILNTNKLERGAMKLRVSQQDICALMSRVQENLSFDAVRKNIKLELRLPGDKLEFFADGTLLERVITNLAGNSLKFTPHGGRVALGCRETAEGVVFTVEDTGPGIPPDKRQLIFEKYAQMEEHRSLGFGLGLAMCKMAVELHKGSIWVESEVGKGSKFTFMIPRGLEQAPAPPAPAKEGGAGPSA